MVDLKADCISFDKTKEWAAQNHVNGDYLQLLVNSIRYKVKELNIESKMGRFTVDGAVERMKPLLGNIYENFILTNVNGQYKDKDGMKYEIDSLIHGEKYIILYSYIDLETVKRSILILPSDKSTKIMIETDEPLPDLGIELLSSPKIPLYKSNLIRIPVDNSIVTFTHPTK